MITFLYTSKSPLFNSLEGCECNYDLCKRQRGGDYNTWKWFDFCLYWAIFRLCKCESGSFGVYSGLNNVKLDTKKIDEAYFVTYVSTTWQKLVAEEFMEDKGLMLEVDKTFKDDRAICCDVSWISKFQDECEILFARSNVNVQFHHAFKEHAFECEILDETKNVQTVGVSGADLGKQEIKQQKYQLEKANHVLSSKWI